MKRVKKLARKKLAIFFEDKLISFVFKESGIAFILKAIAALFGFVFNVILARMLDPSDLGVYFLVFTANNFSGLLARHGLEKISIRYIAAYSVVSDYKSLNSFYRFSQLFIWSISTGISTLSALMVFIFYRNGMVSNDLFIPLILSLGLGTLPAAMSTIYAQYLKAINLTRSAVLILSFYKPFFSIPLSVILIYYWGLNGAVLSFILASIATWCIGYFTWKIRIKQKISQSTIIYSEEIIPRKNIYKSSVFLLLESLMQLIIKQSPTFFLGLLSTSDNIGLYNIAFRTSFLLAFFLSAVDFVVSSKYSEFFQLSRLDLVSSLAQKTTFLMCICMFPILILLISFSTQILTLFGTSYTTASNALIILSVAQLVNVATGSVKTILTMSGNEKYVFMSTGFSAFIAIVLCFSLIPLFGLFGAALSAAIALSIQNIFMIVLTYRKLGISTIPFLRANARKKGIN